MSARPTATIQRAPLTSKQMRNIYVVVEWRFQFSAVDIAETAQSLERFEPNQYVTRVKLRRRVFKH